MRYLVTAEPAISVVHIVLTLLDVGTRSKLSTICRPAIERSCHLPPACIRLICAMAQPLTDFRGASMGWRVSSCRAFHRGGKYGATPFITLKHNFTSSLNLIRTCTQHGVRKLVIPLNRRALRGAGPARCHHGGCRDHSGSAYGESKFFIERTLHWADRVHGLRSACLRYFNAAGRPKWPCGGRSPAGNASHPACP